MEKAEAEVLADAEAVKLLEAFALAEVELLRAWKLGKGHFNIINKKHIFTHIIQSFSSTSRNFLSKI